MIAPIASTPITRAITTRFDPPWLLAALDAPVDAALTSTGFATAGALVTATAGAAFLTAARFAGAFFATFLTTFFAAAFFAGAFLATFFGAAFFATFFAGAFLAAFLTAARFAGAFFAAYFATFFVAT
jgi:hypothetical protein